MRFVLSGMREGSILTRARSPVYDRSRQIVRTLAVCALLVVSGCASFEKTAEPPPEIALPEPSPLPAEPAEPLPEPVQVPRRAEPESDPEPQSELEVQEPAPGRIAIVLSDRSPAYEGVAIELGHLLDRVLLYNLADKSLSPGAVFSGIADSDAKVVIAIGIKAAEQAMALSTLPVVFCQVFNIDVSGSKVPIRGVSSIPPLAPQIRAWKELNPDLQHIGAIVGGGHDELLAEARRAAADNGITLHIQVATSDRETLYMFNRMAPEIDGFWLFPDNRVLSIGILKEMLSYAKRQEVEIAVFNTGLLQMGAALSTTTVDSDIARTAIEVADRMIGGEIESIPARTLLTRVDVRSPGRAAMGTAAKGQQ